MLLFLDNGYFTQIEVLIILVIAEFHSIKFLLYLLHVSSHTKFQCTGASIQVASEMLPASTERAVTISGTAEAVTQCIRNVCGIMLEVTSDSFINPLTASAKLHTVPWKVDESIFNYRGVWMRFIFVILTEILLHYCK